MKINLSNVFSVDASQDERYIIRILGFKISIQKRNVAAQRKQNPYYYYKKNNIDITTIPPITGDARDRQLIGLYMLKQLDEVCKKHNINYWLDFGALLGAVRHKGFIPWDDDIDIGIMRKDYNKLMQVFDSTVKDKDLFLGFRVSDTEILLKIYHKKISHIFIDIFPYDFYNENLTKDEQIIKTTEYKALRKNFLQKERSKDPLEFHNSFQELTNDFTNLNEEKYVIWGFEFGHNWKKWIHEYNTIFPLTELEFEGEKYPCIRDYDTYLKDVYGDYMAYPKKISVGHFMYKNFTVEEKKLMKELIKK